MKNASVTVVDYLETGVEPVRGRDACLRLSDLTGHYRIFLFSFQDREPAMISRLAKIVGHRQNVASPFRALREGLPYSRLRIVKQ